MADILRPTVAVDAGVQDRLRLAAVWVDGVRVTTEDGAFSELLAVASRWRRQVSGSTLGSVSGVGEARRLYRAFGIDPTRTRPSSEALLRRALKDLGFHRVNNVVDAGNAVSLEHLLPLGLYDRDRIGGDVVTVRCGREGEGYRGVGGADVHVAGRLTVADATGAFGSPTRDSERTCVVPQTTRLLALVFAPADGEAARLERAAAALSEACRRHAGGTVVAVKMF